MIAFDNDRFLILWAAQSAWIAVAGIPHTFSVYVLKKIEYSRRPNRAVTQPSKWDWSVGGLTLAHAYEATHRTASTMPSPRSAFIARNG